MHAPERIVSLVPSLTELVCWLGCADRLVGRTRFCVEPIDEVDRVPPLGGTKDPDVAAIIALGPDLVIANKEENRREDVEALRSAGIRVLLTDPNTVPEAVAMVGGLGEILDCASAAEQLATGTETALQESAAGTRCRVFVAIWKHPLMGLGAGTYGHDLIERCGAVNVLGDRPRYPEIPLAELAALSPDLVLLPDEPYRFRETDGAMFEPVAPARLVDGRLLWWYGPRMPEAIRTLTTFFRGTTA